MFVIDKRGKIILTRGDTATITLDIKDADGIPYKIKNTDTVTFSVRRTINSNVEFSKTLTEDGFFIIEGEDTYELPLGIHMYDVDLITEDGYKYTIIPANYFELKGAI